MKLDGKSIQTAIVQLVEDYKFDPYTVLDIIQQGIRTGFRKDFPDYKQANVQVSIDNDGTVKIYKVTDIVEEVEDPETQMTVKEAQKIREDVQVGEQLLSDITPESLELSRIAAQAAAQTIKQNLKSIERERFYEKFQNKEGELLKAKVIRVQGETVILDIEKTAVVLTPDGQIPHRMYEPGEEIFVLLQKISKDKTGVVLEITQSTESYIQAILRKLVPELEEGVVTIEKISRIPGKRTKIIVSSSDEQVDPVGVMVGHRGDRINTVLSLLDGEKVDYIEHIDNMEQLIAACLKPAQVDSVSLEWDKAIVKMAEDQKPLAIGKGASNVKLAAKLTGYNIEIR
jgi:transcription termination/antitermination protein NusA